MLDIMNLFLTGGRPYTFLNESSGILQLRFLFNYESMFRFLFTDGLFLDTIYGAIWKEISFF